MLILTVQPHSHAPGSYVFSVPTFCFTSSWNTPWINVLVSACYVCHVAKMFSAYSKGMLSLSHQQNVISGCRGYVIAVTWLKSYQVFEKKLCFLFCMKEMYPLLCKSNFLVPTWQNVLFMLQKKCYWGYLENMFPQVTKKLLFGQHDKNALVVLQDKCYFDRIGGTFLSCCVTKGISNTWKRCYILVPKATLYSARDRYTVNM